MIARYIARQFSQPTGLLGRVIGRGMARQNEREARWTVDLLDIDSDARVLEIGFGPGVAIQYAAERATRGHVSGIDYSETMLKIARKRNASGIATGVVDLTKSDVQSLPYADDSFDRAFAIHCVYFWREPAACLREIRRVLRPDGVVAITIRPTNQWQGRKPPADVFHLYRGDEVAKLLSDSGFRRPRVEPYPQPDKPGECILALK
jgi:ubiquinone/menaquinone biosynthesis C-methylase UbiE